MMYDFKSHKIQQLYFFINQIAVNPKTVFWTNVGKIVLIYF